jgi:hypothetical protein
MAGHLSERMQVQAAAAASSLQSRGLRNREEAFSGGLLPIVSMMESSDAGKLQEVMPSEDCMIEGRPDPNKVRPFIFAGADISTGEYIGAAFRFRIAIIAKAKLDSRDGQKRERQTLTLKSGNDFIGREQCNGHF